MRACSRCVAGSRSACSAVDCGTGSETRWLSGILVQDASSSAASASAAPRVLFADMRVAVIASPIIPSLLRSCSVCLSHDPIRKPVPTFRDHALFRELDLFGAVGRDDRAAALFDPAAHPDAAAFQPLRLEAGRENVRCWRLRMVTVKSRVQRHPKFTYIVAPLSRTDK